MQTIPSNHGFIHRFQKCVGFRLFRLGRWQAELWYCPSGQSIPPHVHQHIESRILYLAGSLLFRREDKTQPMKGWRSRLKFLKVAANQEHSATVTGRFGLFLNLEHWTNHNITSAAIDFHAT